MGVYELFFTPNGNVQDSNLPLGGLCPAMTCSTSSVFKFNFLSPQSIPQVSDIFSDLDLHLTLCHWYKQTFKTEFSVNCAALHTTQGKHETGCRCHRRNGGILNYHVMYNRKKGRRNKKGTIKYTHVFCLDFT